MFFQLLMFFTHHIDSHRPWVMRCDPDLTGCTAYALDGGSPGFYGHNIQPHVHNGMLYMKTVNRADNKRRAAMFVCTFPGFSGCYYMRFEQVQQFLPYDFPNLHSSVDTVNELILFAGGVRRVCAL